MIHMGDENFDELPIELRILALLLYFLPIPLILLACVNLFLLLFNFFTVSDSRWVVGAIIALALAAYLYLCGLSITHTKKIAPAFILTGILLACIALILYVVLEPSFFTFLRYTNIIVWRIIAALVIVALVVIKNKNIFVN